MIKPTRGNVLIELIDEKEKEVGGIVIPEKTEERQAKGKVIEMGTPNRNLITGEIKSLDGSLIKQTYDVEFKKGAIVWFKRFAGEKVKDNGKDYLIVPYKEILGVVV